MVIFILEILFYIWAGLSVISLLFGWASFRMFQVKFLEATMALIGLFMFPLHYPFRKAIYKNPKLFKILPPFFYWFVNSDEETFIDNWYGVYEILDGDYEKFEKMNFINKFFLSWKWVGFQNPSWNFKNLIGKHVIGEMTDIKVKALEGNAPAAVWRNKTIFGKQHITFKVRKTKHFRYSYTREMKKSNPLRYLGILTKFKPYKYINLMWGTGDTRYITKLRIWL